MKQVCCITSGIATLVLSLASCGKKEEAAPAPNVVTQRATAEVICSYAPSQSVVVGHLAAAAGGSAIAAASIAKAAGLTAVLHSSGAYIFTGSSGYLAGTLGTAIAVPIIVGIGAVVGGSAVTLELLCAPKNHPEFNAKVQAAATEFYARSKNIRLSATKSIEPMIVEVKSSVGKFGNDALNYANRKSVSISDALKAYRK